MKKSKTIDRQIARLNKQLSNIGFTKHEPDKPERIDEALKPSEYIDIWDSTIDSNGKISYINDPAILSKREINKVTKELKKVYDSWTALLRQDYPDIRIKSFKDVPKAKFQQMVVAGLMAKEILIPDLKNLLEFKEHYKTFETDFTKELDKIQPGLFEKFHNVYIERNNNMDFDPEKRTIKKKRFCAAISILWLALKKYQDFKMDKNKFCDLAKDAYGIKKISISMWKPSQFEPEDKELYKLIDTGGDRSSNNNILKNIIELVK